MAHVTLVNISIKSDIFIYTEGLVTIQVCTAHARVWFYINMSQHEPYFTYKTAEMVPSVINNRTINFMNTSFHYYLHFSLLSGIRTVNIINCDFVADNNQRVTCMVRKKSVETKCSHDLTVLNITIMNTIFRDYELRYTLYGKESIISLKVINSSFDDSKIMQMKSEGFLGAVFEESRFHKSYFLLFQATSVSVRNCKYDVSDGFVDNIKIVGNINIPTEPRIIQNAIKLLIFPVSHIHSHFPTVYFENTIFTGNLNNQTDSVTKINEANLIIRNVTFHIYQKFVNRKRWYISHTSVWNGIIVELINVTINARSMPSASSIAMISTERFHMENFKILCPVGLQVVNISNTYEEQFSCEQQCSADGYTFQTGSAVINGIKEHLRLYYDIQ